MTSLKDKIKDKKPQIIWAEGAAILHDIGKLSEEFINYRQKWQKGEDGWKWDNDPHVKEFLDKHDRLIDKYSGLRSWFDYKETINDDKVSITDAVHWHIKPDDEKKDNLFLKMLRAADGVDAAIDRNNPLFSAEQTAKVFDTDVFGAELKSIEPSDLTKSRKYLYEALLKITLPDGTTIRTDNKERQTLLETIKKYFDQAFSDTTRPNNDTSLWEHCYAVASILKVILVHKEIYGEEMDDYKKVRFGILGIGWDGLSYLSKGHKIADISGRKAIIDDLKRDIKEKIEWDYSIGNSIYEDDNGIFFLVPILPKEIDLEETNFSRLSEYGQLLQEIQKEITETTIRLTCGEICPKFHMIQDTRFITHLVRCIQEIRKKAAFPVSRCSDLLKDKLEKEWKEARRNNHENKVCPICRLKPVIDEEKGICTNCFEIRKRGSFFKKGNDDENDETAFIQEIAMANDKDGMKRRAALIVANIGLENWLNGKMVRSLFVTEAKGLEKEFDALGTIKDFENGEMEIRQWLANSPFGNLIVKGYDYHRIKEEVDYCYNYDEATKNEMDYAKNVIFLYGRRTIGNNVNRDPKGTNVRWDEFLQAAIEEHGLFGKDCSYLLYNILCAKTPTPSTILDVWNTTQKFFESFRDIKEEKLLGIGQKKRWRVGINKPGDAFNNTPYEGKIGEAQVEAVWIDNNSASAWIIGDINEKGIKPGDELLLKGRPFKKEGYIKVGAVSNSVKDVNYFPVRIITSTPDTFMAIVPADKAIEVTQNIYNEYVKRFGKVTGRLSLSIGNIFFTEKMPMFVVLDAGRRMIDNFGRLHKESIHLRVSKDHEPCQSGVENLSIKIGEIVREETATAKSLTFKFPCKLGDNSTDFYHPYLMVKKDGKDYSNRKNYFRTLAGDVIYCTKLEPGDILEVFPNYYDFEFLDSNTRRHDLCLNKSNRRKSNVAKFNSRPFFLEELDQKIINLWNNLKGHKGMTDTKLRNIQSLWLSKFQEWGIKEENQKEWMKIVSTSVKNEIAGLDNALLFESIKSGLFFDSLELYLGILKERIDDKKGGN